MPPSGSQSDGELLERARRGESKALEKLLRRYQPMLLRFGLKMCRHRQDAEDVVQESMLAAVKNISSFRGSANVSTWLYTIARSFCIKKRRKSKFAPAREESIEQDTRREVRTIASSANTPEEAAFSHELGHAMDKAIGDLEDNYREVLVLRDIEGLKADEVSEVLGISVAAVKSRLHRGRKILRSQLAPWLENRPSTPAPMGCPDIITAFSQKLEGDIDANICADMEAHVKACPHCDARCNSLKRVLSICSASPTPEVPSHLQEAVKKAVETLTP